MKIRPAQAILLEIREGQLLNELACAFHNAIANVREHGKGCEVIVKIKIGTMDSSKHKLVEPPILMQGKVVEKLYEPEPNATVFFVDAEGNATRNLTRQETLNLTAVAGGGAPAAAEGGKTL